VEEVLDEQADVVVVGGGNAALCAALAARQEGASVVVLERAPEQARGGNSAFTAGAMRVAYKGVDDILALVGDMDPAQLARTDFGAYTVDQFFDDLVRVTEHRTDPELAFLIADQSFETLRWMRSQGVRFLPIYGRQAYEINGQFKFWGGLTLETAGGGLGLVESLSRAATQAGIPIRYGSRAVELTSESGAATGVVARTDGRDSLISAKAVVLAAGGFESNAEWRTKYLGPGWDLAKVRGTRYNTGDGIRMAMEAGATPWGHWSGAHAVGWDYNAPPFGDITVGDGFQKHSYPLGIMVNLRGERFVDEGADFRNYTYAKYGAEILRQPGQVAWQVFDNKVTHLLRDEYRIRRVTRVVSDTLEGLAAQIDDLDQDGFLRTVQRYNAAIDTAVEFDPNILDQRRTRGLPLDKSNWANALDSPPFEAYAVTCGVTFTFGGVHISPGAEVLDDNESAIGGLYAAGEMVGGLFYFNYPGGSGLTAGAVLGRIAGRGAALHAATTAVESNPGTTGVLS
jgi:tricarballylate dehydrogenase